MRNIFLTSIITLILGPFLNAQVSEYNLFKSVIEEIFQESQIGKKEKIAAYEKSKEEVKPYQNRKPEISVLGMDKEKAEQLEKKLQESIHSQDNQTIDSEKKANKEHNKTIPKHTKIQFKQVYMEEGKGEALEPAYSQKPKKTEWVTSETQTFTYEEIIIEENLNDDQKKEHVIIGTHNGNTIELNRIGFIEALHKEAQSLSSYTKLKDDLKKAGHDLSPIFKRSTMLNSNEQRAFIKTKLLEIIDNVVNL